MRPSAITGDARRASQNREGESGALDEPAQDGDIIAVSLYCLIVVIGGRLLFALM